MNAQKIRLDAIVLRSSEYIERAVNRGLVTAMLNGVAAGAVVMREGGVPLHVSKRVLVNSKHRRTSDWQ